MPESARFAARAERDVRREVLIEPLAELGLVAFDGPNDPTPSLVIEGGRVVEKTGPESVRAEILVRMGAMSMTFAGTVEIVEKDDAAHRAVMRVKSKETGGTGYANADVTFTLSDGGGTVHTAAQISGKAASMGEGVVQSVLDALVTDFTGKLATL